PARRLAEVSKELWIGLATSLLETFDICPGLCVVLLKKCGHSAVIIGLSIIGVEGECLGEVRNGAVIGALITIGTATVVVGSHIARVEGQGLGVVGDSTVRVPLPLIGRATVIVGWRQIGIES